MLQTNKYLLRALEPSDIELTHQWENDMSLWPEGSTRTPISRADVANLIEHSNLDVYQTRQMRLMIEEKTTKNPIGCVDMFDFDPFNMHCAVGIMVVPSHRRQGVASSVLSVFCEYLRSVLSLQAIEATARAENVASIKMLEKAGFHQLGIRPSWIRNFDGSFSSEIIFMLSD